MYVIIEKLKLVKWIAPKHKHICLAKAVVDNDNYDDDGATPCSPHFYILYVNSDPNGALKGLKSCKNLGKDVN